MTTKSRHKTTNVDRRSVLTADEAKQRLYARGITLTAFAEKHGFKFRTVSEVVRGVNKARNGEGHRVAVALGMK